MAFDVVTGVGVQPERPCVEVRLDEWVVGEQPVAVVGDEGSQDRGAGTFDGISVTGILAVLLAAS